MRVNAQTPPEGFAVKLALAANGTQRAARDTDTLHTNLYRQV